jgi:ribosomal protein S18 acetylase RimI-like enzyme
MRRSRGVSGAAAAFIVVLECWTLVWVLLLASSMPYYSCHGLTPLAWIGFRGRQSQSQSLPTKETREQVSSSESSSSNRSRRIRIRSTQATDLPEIATILSTAAINNNESGRWNWKISMDRLWAKADIEALLRPRLDAIQEGRKTLARISHLNLESMVDDCLEDQTRLKLLWGNDRFRRSVLKASRETGEPNVWQKHNFALAPKDTSWLYHLQITAEDAATGKVIGFVEVAVLSNPDESRRKTQREQNESSENKNDSDAISNNSNNDDDSCSLVYSPAITNLAVSEDWRRRGIATRLLQTAARFARQEWEAQDFGLFVEKTNSAAIALYQRNGYTVKKSCTGGAQLGDMFYMVCPIKNIALTRKATTGSTRAAERDYA